jgi:hypothetical protein
MLTKIRSMFGLVLYKFQTKINLFMNDKILLNYLEKNICQVYYFFDKL